MRSACDTLTSALNVAGEKTLVSFVNAIELQEEWGLFIAPVQAAMNEHADGFFGAAFPLPGANTDMKIGQVSDLGSVAHPPRVARNRVGIALRLVRISDGQLPQQGAKVTAPGGGILERLPSGRVGEGDGRGRVSHGLDVQRPNMVPDRDAGRAELVGRDP